MHYNKRAAAVDPITSSVRSRIKWSALWFVRPARRSVKQAISGPKRSKLETTEDIVEQAVHFAVQRMTVAFSAENLLQRCGRSHVR
jgi:hypothetical protein